MTSVAGVAAPMAGWSGTKDWAIALLRVPSASLTFPPPFPAAFADRRAPFIDLNYPFRFIFILWCGARPGRAGQVLALSRHCFRVVQFSFTRVTGFTAVPQRSWNLQSATQRILRPPGLSRLTTPA